jgi:hypothetical protein
MSEAQPPSSPHNGNGRRNGGSVLVSISERLIRVLPPAFLLLLVMNVMFLGVVAWVVDHNSEARNALLTRIVEKCLLAPSGRP